MHVDPPSRSGPSFDRLRTVAIQPQGERPWGEGVRSSVAALTLGLASLLLAAMALVAFGDVAMRVLGRPITGAYEVTGLLVAALVYAGLPGVTMADEHVRAGILAGWVEQRPRVSATLRWLRRITTALTMGVLAWAMARYAWKLAAVGDRAPFIELPLAWAAAFGAVLLALAAWLALLARPAAQPLEQTTPQQTTPQNATPPDGPRA